MFDAGFFTESLSSACPQITIIPNSTLLESSIQKAELTPKELGNKFKVDRVMDFADEWRSLFDKWVPAFNEPTPILVSIRPSFFEWPILHDSPAFIATFGRILKFNSTLLDLAAVVLYALDKQHNLHIDPGQIGIPQQGKFYGAHLRTAPDAVAASFATYEEQSRAYLSSAKKNKLSLIYLASGSPPDIERFTKTAAEKGVSVTTKLALLENNPEFVDALKMLQELTWDQQALIDYMILLRSSMFGGTWASSFSYNIVFRRHVVLGHGVWVPSLSALEEMGTKLEGKGEKRWWFGRKKVEEGKCFEDGISEVFGGEKMGLWFELSMWP